MTKQSSNGTGVAEAKFTERRGQRRYKFAALVELSDSAGVPITGRVSDLGVQGCFVTTKAPLPVGSIVKVCLTQNSTSFHAIARVVYSIPTKGAGLLFTSIEESQVRVLDQWVANTREGSWFESTRRRSQRVFLEVPVIVSGTSPQGITFQEKTTTIVINAHGASLVWSADLPKGHRVVLTHARTKEAQECVIIFAKTGKDDRFEMGVEFIVPNPSFWHIKFPPDDWSFTERR